MSMARHDDDDDDDRLGIPMGRLFHPGTSQTATAAEPMTEEEEFQSVPDESPSDEPFYEYEELRPGDPGLGIPHQGPLAAAMNLTQEEGERSYRNMIDERNELYDQDGLASAISFQMPSMVKHMMTIFFLGAISLLMLFVISQGTALYSNLQLLGEPAQYVLGTLVLVIVGALLWVTFRLAQLYFTLSMVNQIDLKALHALSDRKCMRLAAQATEKMQEGRRLLIQYLETFPLETKREQELIKVGLNKEEIHQLREIKKTLLAPSAAVSSREWILNFQANFQSILDKSAQRRTAYYANRAGLGAVLSRRSLIDVSIILYASFALVADMCVIYNLRMKRLNMMIILLQAMFTTYIAGVTQDLSESTLDMLGEHHHETAGHVLSGAVGDVMGKATKLVGVRAEEFIINTVLLRRLGKTASRMLQPTRA